MTTLADIDGELTRYDNVLANALTNLLELKDILAYSAIFGDKAWLKLEGMTKQRAEPIINDFKDLWQHFSLIQKKVDEAKTLRNRDKRPAQATIDAVWQMLKGPSIDLPTQTVPLQKRGLLTGSSTAANKISPEDLLHAMVNSFDQAKAIVFEIQGVWDKVEPTLEELGKEATALHALAKEVGAEATELAQFDALRAACEKKIHTDPLSAGTTFDAQLKPSIDTARQRLTGLKERFVEVKRDLEHAQDTMRLLRDTSRKAKEAYTERCDKVSVPDADKLPKPIDDSVVDDLGTWLDQLNAKMAALDWMPVRMGIANWSKQALIRLQSCQQAYMDNIALVNERRDLRAALDAFRAKAQDLGKVERPELVDLVRRAKALLYTRPTPMVEARKLVDQYAESLR